MPIGKFIQPIERNTQSLLWFHLNAGSCGAESPNGGRGGSGSSSISNSNNNGNGRRPLQPPLHRARDAFAPEELVGKVDRLFFFGDLNYRLELPREDVEVRALLLHPSICFFPAFAYFCSLLLC